MPVVPDPYALTTLATAKEHLGIPVLNTQYDDVVQRFINEATAKIERYCDRKFVQRTGIIEYQDGFANDRILLDQWPAQKPTELWIDNSREFTDPAKQLAADEYELDYSASGDGIGVVLVKRCFFPRGIKNIKIVYDGGYTAIPSDLEGACLWTVSFYYDMRNTKSVGVETVGKNQENTTYRGDLPPIVLYTLDSYKRAEWPTGDRAVQTR